MVPPALLFEVPHHRLERHHHWRRGRDAEPYTRVRYPACVLEDFQRRGLYGVSFNGRRYHQHLCTKWEGRAFPK